MVATQDNFATVIRNKLFSEEDGLDDRVLDFLENKNNDLRVLARSVAPDNETLPTIIYAALGMKKSIFTRLQDVEQVQDYPSSMQSVLFGEPYNLAPECPTDSQVASEQQIQDAKRIVEALSSLASRDSHFWHEHIKAIPALISLLPYVKNPVFADAVYNSRGAEGMSGTDFRQSATFRNSYPETECERLKSIIKDCMQMDLPAEAYSPVGEIIKSLDRYVRHMATFFSSPLETECMIRLIEGIYIREDKVVSIKSEDRIKPVKDKLEELYKAGLFTEFKDFSEVNVRPELMKLRKEATNKLVPQCHTIEDFYLKAKSYDQNRRGRGVAEVAATVM